jgi:hypothetical protein
MDGMTRIPVRSSELILTTSTLVHRARRTEHLFWVPPSNLSACTSKSIDSFQISTCILISLVGTEILVFGTPLQRGGSRIKISLDAAVCLPPNCNMIRIRDYTNQHTSWCNQPVSCLVCNQWALMCWMSSRYGKNRVRFKNIEWIFGKKNNLHFTFLLLSITIVFDLHFNIILQSENTTKSLKLSGEQK